MRELNASRIIQELRANGPLSRAQLAAAFGVRRGTIGAVTKRLIDLNILEEREVSPTGRTGRPATPLWFGRRAVLCGGVAVQHDSIDSAVVNIRGDVLAHHVAHLDPASDPKTIDRAVSRLIRKTERGFREEFVKFGVSVPAMYDYATGEIPSCPQLPGLAGTHLHDMLKAGSGERAIVDNDSRASALGEQWFGAGRAQDSFATIQAGVGIGVGIVIDGTVLRNPAGISAEVGHTCVDRNGEMCGCGLRGCWETIASTQWLQRAAAGLDLPGAHSLRVCDLADLARREDIRAVGLMDQYADNLSVGLANLAQALGIRRFILQGEVIQGGERLRHRLETTTRSRVFTSRSTDVVVEMSEMGDQAGVLSAAAIALEGTLQGQV